MKKPGNRLPEGTKTSANPVPTPPADRPGEPDSGDSDEKGHVDIPDYAIVTGNFGRPVGEPGDEGSADLNRDDATAIANFGIFVRNDGEEDPA